ncbi:MAG: ribosomal subunit interface protein [Candidatus Cloacimonadota bacterium]|nr:MAG: ribosomal subunit interface protein [Candidatus Cloacimonadota bacterium]
MQITITARHFGLSNAIRDHVKKSCEKLSRYFDQIINIHFILSLENNRTIAEMTLHASHFNLKSETEHQDMYIALDKTIERMEAQIKKLKDKVTDHQKKRLKEDPHFVYANLIHRNEEKKRKVMKIKRIHAEIMDIDEAIESLNESKAPYKVFKNVETDRVCVLVKKDDEHYKLIEP